MDRRKLPHAPGDVPASLLEGGSAANGEGARLAGARSTVGTIDNLASSKHRSP